MAMVTIGGGCDSGNGGNGCDDSDDGGNNDNDNDEELMVQTYWPTS